MTDPNEVAETFRPFLAAIGHEEIIPAIALAVKDAQREGFAEAMRGNDLADKVRDCLEKLNEIQSRHLKEQNRHD